ncbi:MAG: 30S ribosomal protein S16 [Bacteroidota bacterium]
MVTLRLQRRGRKKRPYYHIVCADSRSPRDGRIIEDLGRFDNLQNPPMLQLDTERVLHWLEKGAQPSDNVRSILKKEGIMYRMHLRRWGKDKEEIDQIIEEWKAEKGEEEVDEKTKSQREKQRQLLEAEEKEYQKQLEQKAKEEAARRKAEEAAKKAEEEAAAKEVEEAEKAEAKAEAEKDSDDADADADSDEDSDDEDEDTSEEE